MGVPGIFPALAQEFPECYSMYTFEVPYYAAVGKEAALVTRLGSEIPQTFSVIVSMPLGENGKPLTRSSLESGSICDAQAAQCTLSNEDGEFLPKISLKEAPEPQISSSSKSLGVATNKYDNFTSKSLQPALSCSSLYLDTNCLIHSFAAHSAEYIETNNPLEFHNIFLIIEYIIEAIDPQDMVYISIGILAYIITRNN